MSRELRAPGGLKSELSASQLGIEAEGKKCTVVLEPGIAPSAMVDVEEKYVLEEKVGNAVDLNYSLRVLYAVLMRPMISTCLLYYILFQGLLEVIYKIVEDSFEEVPAVVGDQPYNMRRIAALPNSGHYFLSMQDTNQFVDDLSAAMDLSALLQIFCPPLQLKNWYEMLVSKVGTVLKKEHVMKNEEVPGERPTVLKP